MAQITIYLDDETAGRLKRAAAAAGTSVSAWLGALVRERTEETWSQAFLDALGAAPDFPLAEELRATDVPDLPRVEL